MLLDTQAVKMILLEVSSFCVILMCIEQFLQLKYNLVHCLYVLQEISLS